MSRDVAGVHMYCMGTSVLFGSVRLQMNVLCVLSHSCPCWCLRVAV